MFLGAVAVEVVHPDPGLAVAELGRVGGPFGPGKAELESKLILVKQINNPSLIFVSKIVCGG